MEWVLVSGTIMADLSHAAMTRYSTGISSPREAEAEGLVQALQWVQRLHLSNINFEVDCKNVVDFVLNRKRQL